MTHRRNGFSDPRTFDPQDFDGSGTVSTKLSFNEWPVKRDCKTTGNLLWNPRNLSIFM